MKLRTEISIPESNYRFYSNTKVLTIGSCFSEVIGSKLIESKINCLSNPFGTIFNPLSILKLLTNSIEDNGISNHLYTFREDQWFHHDFHSDFSNESKEELSKTLSAKMNEVRTFLKSADYLVITFGTAIGYQLKNSKQIVANCHKIPGQNFTKELVSLKELISKFDVFDQSLRRINKKIKIILTVSPVRHTKETLQLNSLSKATLRLACHNITEQFERTEYFPSFEIMTDDLRDYRFYEEDMIHPNKQAKNHIFEWFSRTYFSKELEILVSDWSRIKKSLAHNPRNQNTPANLSFLQSLKSKLTELSLEIDVRKELSEVEAKLIAYETC